jgi:membrane peptidoglycan carboxypeptidase
VNRDHHGRQYGGHRLGPPPEDPWAWEEFGPLTRPLNLDLLRRRRRKRMWRWIRRICYVVGTLVVVPPALAFVVGYYTWDVPSPDAIAQATNQTVVIDYANGSELTRLVPSTGNRTAIQDVRTGVSEPMRNATLAAEDPTFYQNPGFDVLGILRAVWGQLSGNGDSGGSTLTQQYIKLATGNDQHTYSRKFKEIVLAFKMSREDSKDEILKAYLNTAYYGRGAYGIDAAAHTFFGKQPKDLSADEAAVLAGMVQQPTSNDPRIDPEQGQNRFNYVMGQMARYHFITPEQQLTLRLPQTNDLSGGRDGGLTATQYNIRQQVLLELDRAGYSEQTLEQHGYTVVTNIDPRAQKAAEDSVSTVLQGQPSNLHPSLVAVDPKTDAIRAYYGGGGNAGGFDYAAAPQQPGSSFKPFVALAGLKQGHGLGETYDGSSPQTIAGTTFSNDPGVACSNPTQCTVREAMTKSVNTVFVNMAVQFGTSNVATAAYQAGIPRQTADGKPTLQNPNGQIDAGIALGQYPVSTISMAGAYATFADNGMRNTPHFVQKIVDGSGTTIQDFTPQPQAAFDTDPVTNANLAANVTDSLSNVAAADHLLLAGGRPVAAKTGTSQFGAGDSHDNSTAWMVGYTPQITAAVSLSAGDATHPVQPVRDANGNPVYGVSIPGPVWQRFMNAYLTGQPVQPFPHAQPIGRSDTPPSSESSSEDQPFDPFSNLPHIPGLPGQQQPSHRHRR